MTRQKLINLGLLTPASVFYNLPDGDPQKEAYYQRIILAGIDPRPWVAPQPLQPKENN